MSKINVLDLKRVTAKIKNGQIYAYTSKGPIVRDDIREIPLEQAKEVLLSPLTDAEKRNYSNIMMDRVKE